EELENIIRKALACKVEDRYLSANELADDLLGFLFSHRLKVSARDLSALLKDVRAHKDAEDARHKAGGDGGLNLIEQLMAEELANFRSIDEDSGQGASDSQAGARSLINDDDLGEFDSS